MKFNLGRAKSLEEERPVEEQTLRRWRATAGKEESKKQVAHLEEVGGEEDVSSSSTDQGTGPSFVASDSDRRAVAPVTSNSQLSVEDDLQRRFGRLRAALGTGTVIQGKLSFDSPVRIDGSLSGEVGSTSTLIVGEQGIIDAQVKVGSLIVLGQVTGQVEAEDLIEIKAGGRVEADILTRRIVLEEGAFFEGGCRAHK